MYLKVYSSNNYGMVFLYSLFKKFKALAPELVKQDRNVRLPMEIMLNYPELKYNPFGDRICQVFSSTNNGDCTFDDFVDMLSVFNSKASINFKAEYAFRIFGEFLYEGNFVW